jgi:glycosyltransferase involved in cell wall biosynthesis
MALRALHLLGSFSQGGSTRQALALAGLMRGRGRFDIEVATVDRRGPAHEEAVRLGFSDIGAFPLTRVGSWNLAVQVRRAAAWMRDRQIALVHTHDFQSNVVGVLAARMAGIARIASRDRRGRARTLAGRLLERRIYALSHAIVSDSEFAQAGLWRDGVSADKTCVIPPGLDRAAIVPLSTRSRSETLAKLGLPEHPRFISMLAEGRRSRRDGEWFLRAARRVHARIPEARFIFLADERDPANGEGSIRRLASELGIGPAVHILSACPADDVVAISEICAIASADEGIPAAMLEYFASGRPVVAADTGGARQAVLDGRTGYLVPAGDEPAMARRLIHLLLYPHRGREMGERGRRFVTEEFSWDTRLRRTEALYERVLGARSSPWGTWSSWRFISG